MIRARFCCELRIHDAVNFEKEELKVDSFCDAIIIRTFASDFSTCVRVSRLLKKPCWVVTYEDFSTDELRANLKKLEDTTWYLLTLCQGEVISGSIETLRLNRSYYRLKEKNYFKRLLPPPIPENSVGLPEDSSIKIENHFSRNLGSRLYEIARSASSNEILWAFKLCCIAEFEAMAKIFALWLQDTTPYDTDVLPFLQRHAHVKAQIFSNAALLIPRVDKDLLEKIAVELRESLKQGQWKEVLERITDLKKKCELNFDLEILTAEAYSMNTGVDRAWVHEIVTEMMLLHPEATQGSNWKKLAELWSKTFRSIISLNWPDPTKIKLNPQGDTALVIVSRGRRTHFRRALSSFAACSDFSRIRRVYCLLEKKFESKENKFREVYNDLHFIISSTLEGAQEGIRDVLMRDGLTYALVFDDSYQFLAKCDFIGQAEKLMKQEHDLGQVVINRNYAVAVREIDTEVADVCRVNKELFFRHAMHKGKNANWPHFSFQPAVHKIHAWKEVGPFAETNMEVDYAWRYWKAGFRTGFLPLIYCYKADDLAKRERKVEEIVKTVHRPKFEIKVINLARRADRWRKISDKLGDELIMAERFDAVDGQAITLTAEETKIFEGNSFNWRAGIVGCALSHYRLWKQLIDHGDINAYLILEDDVELSVNCGAKLAELSKQYTGQNLVYLGASIYRDKRTPERYDLSAKESKLRVWDYKDRATLDTYCNGGAFAYLISRDCAKLCCAEVERRGIKVPIDCFFFDLFPKLDVWEYVPYPVYTEYVDARVDQKIDSDIQMVQEQVKR